MFFPSTAHSAPSSLDDGWMCPPEFASRERQFRVMQPNVECMPHYLYAQVSIQAELGQAKKGTFLQSVQSIKRKGEKQPTNQPNK